MKKWIATLLTATMMLSLTACGGKTEAPAGSTTQSAPAQQTASDQQNKPAHDSEEGIQAQILMIAEEYENLVARQTEDPSTILVTDMDADGYLELVLMEPGFAMYEVSENEGLVAMGEMGPDNEWVPSLMTDYPYLTVKDADGVYHHIFQTDCYQFFGYEGEESNGTEKTSQVDFTLREDGLHCDSICSIANTYGENGDVVEVRYEIAEEPTEDNYGTYSAMRHYLDNLGGEQYVMFSGGFYSDAMEGLDGDELVEALTDCWNRFSMVRDEPVNTYHDLDGVWMLTAGEVEGSEFDMTEENGNTLLKFTEEEYDDNTCDYIVILEEYDENDELMNYEVNPYMVKYQYAYGNDLWRIDIQDGDILRYGTATICEDGRLCLSAQLVYSEYDYASVLWYFEKVEG